MTDAKHKEYRPGGPPDEPEQPCTPGRAATPDPGDAAHPCAEPPVAEPAVAEPKGGAGPVSDPGWSQLSHIEHSGQGHAARMVDVGPKAVTARSAVARARMRFPSGALASLLAEGGPKGPILDVARTAGILAAKRTAEWIPMCHSLGLDHVEIAFEELDGDRLEIIARTACTGRTGVEMEALTAASAAALTVYDMTKAVCRSTVIEELRLLEKRGGKSGLWQLAE